MAEIKADYASGGSGLTSTRGSARHPPISDVLRDVADDLEASITPVVDWVTGVAVSGSTETLAEPGFLLAIEATAASSTGPKAMTTAAAVAGTVQVVYTAGVPTMNFFAGDAVTEIAYKQLARPIGYTGRKTTKG